MAIIVTAVVTVTTWFVTNSMNRAQKLADRRAEAYVDFFTAISRISNLGRDSKEFQEADLLSLEARYRILLYGTPGVIAALTDFHEGPSSFRDEIGRARHARVIQAMQTDLSGHLASEYQISRLVLLSHEGADERTSAISN